MVVEMQVEWTELNGGVVYVDVTFGRYRRRLQGADHYWVSPPYFGTIVDEAPEGRRTIEAYRARDDGNGDELLGEFRPNDLGLKPKDVDFRSGILLDDEIARSYGLLLPLP